MLIHGLVLSMAAHREVTSLAPPPARAMTYARRPPRTVCFSTFSGL